MKTNVYKRVTEEIKHHFSLRKWVLPSEQTSKMKAELRLTCGDVIATDVICDVEATVILGFSNHKQTHENFPIQE